jgi:photosystem II stability/assembly factor-like uncharacterized protein
MLRRLIVSSALAALALAPSASAGVRVGHSNWEWSNPLPQGNTLRAVDFDGARGYAAGDFGTLIVSDDGGTSWRGLGTGATGDLSEVQVIGGDSLVTAGDCTALRSDDGGATFRRLPWMPLHASCPSPIAALHFPTSEVGYLLQEDGTVHHSDDGGSSWDPISSVPLSAPGALGGARAATDLFFSDANTGFLTTSDGIYRSADGGNSWELVSNWPDLSGLLFVDAGIGYAVGLGQTVVKTTDGGQTWNRSAVDVPGPALSLSSITCLDADHCLTGGERVLVTTDGGDSWSAMPVSVAQPLAVDYASPGGAVVAGAEGAISTSSDGGASWSSVGGRLDGAFTRLTGDSAFLAFAIGQRGKLARTSDEGLTWNYLASPSDQDLVDVSFSYQASGFVLDAAGALHRTDDGGATWEAVHDGASSLPQAVLAIDADHVLLVGSRGIQRSLDGGRTFTPVKRAAVRRAGLFDVDHAGGWLFAYGPTSLFGSRDRGKTWRKLRRPDHRPLAVVDFVSAHRGFALGKGGRVWRTRNRGRSWRELVGTGTDGGMELAFSNTREGYLVASDLFFAKGSDRPDYLLRTTDGGATWRPQLVADSRDLNGLLATRDEVDFLLAGDNQLFSTTSGGDTGRRSSLRLHTRHRKVDRGRKVRIAGRLHPAEAGQLVVVSRTEADPRARKGANDWSFKAVRVRSGGTFATNWKLRRTSVFIAQWRGDGRRAGAGSRALRVSVRK